MPTRLCCQPAGPTKAVSLQHSRSESHQHGIPRPTHIPDLRRLSRQVPSPAFWLGGYHPVPAVCHDDAASVFVRQSSRHRKRPHFLGSHTQCLDPIRLNQRDLAVV